MPSSTPFPPVALPAYTALTVKVRRWSTIRVLNQTYSVPARLISSTCGSIPSRSSRGLLRRERWSSGSRESEVGALRASIIIMLIWSLVKKPGAFTRYRWREELFPSLVFRRAYDALRSFHGDRADAEYVRILYTRGSQRRGGGRDGP